jgi:hypothetical protein
MPEGVGAGVWMLAGVNVQAIGGNGELGEAASERSHPRKVACALAGDVGLVSSLEPLMFLRS